eukprot:TRINITY_DN524_c1_g1_i1.p1 TRINITY_DN524_c1_g1~~TRINITY_DN524_c1_g1_i1.p1  ORF type:complete len:201 (-),score=80.58 TRINITY_DN524_c1_g1_i1:110-712(-)
MKKLNLFCLIVLVLFSLCSCFIFDIEPNQQECFYEEFQTDTTVTFTFQVMLGGALDIDVHVTAPDSRTIYEGSRESEGRFSFTSYMNGVHQFCFSNFMSTVTRKSVNLVVEDEKVNIGQFAKPDDLDPIENALLQLSNSLHNIQLENNRMRLREKAHRNTAESTNARVLWYSFAETLILIFLSIYQIYKLRSFFEVRKTV